MPRQKIHESDAARLRANITSWRLRNPSKYLWSSAKWRSKQNAIDFNIEASDIIIPLRCPVLDIPLVFEDCGPRTDNSPTLDRINPNKGYVVGNVMVVSWRANRLKSDASIQELKSLYEFYRNVIN